MPRRHKPAFLNKFFAVIKDSVFSKSCFRQFFLMMWRLWLMNWKMAAMFPRRVIMAQQKRQLRSPSQKNQRVSQWKLSPRRLIRYKQGISIHILLIQVCTVLIFRKFKNHACPQKGQGGSSSVCAFRDGRRSKIPSTLGRGLLVWLRVFYKVAFFHTFFKQCGFLTNIAVNPDRRKCCRAILI